MSEIGQRGSGDGTAKLMLVVLGLTWGITWPLMKIALTEIPPFSMRLSTTALGALTLAALTKLQRRDFRIPNAERGRISLSQVCSTSWGSACSRHLHS